MENCIRFIAKDPITIKDGEKFEIHYCLKMDGDKIIDAECTVVV